MSDFKAKMHQIVCRMGLRPRPRWGSLQRSPDSHLRSVTHDSLRYINILTYLLTYLDFRAYF